MKYPKLDENEPLKVIEVSQKVRLPNFRPKDGSIPENFEEFETKDLNRLHMKLFTDGEISKESDETKESIDGYYIGKKKYPFDVDTLKTKKVYFKNHSYVITYLLSQEVASIGKVGGWFEFVKDVKIYLRNPKDHKALKEANRVIKTIQGRYNAFDFDSIYGVLFHQGESNEKYDIERKSEDVYSIKRK